MFKPGLNRRGTVASRIMTFGAKKGPKPKADTKVQKFPMVAFVDREGNHKAGNKTQYVELHTTPGEQMSTAHFAKSGKTLSTFTIDVELVEMHAPVKLTVLRTRCVALTGTLALRGDAGKLDLHKSTVVWTPVTKRRKIVGFEMSYPGKYKKFKACFGEEVKKSCPTNSHKAKFLKLRRMKTRAICSRMNSQATTRRGSFESTARSSSPMPSLSELPEMAEDAILPRKPAPKKKLKKRKSIQRMPSLSELPEMAEDAVLPPRKPAVPKKKKTPKKKRKSIQTKVQRMPSLTEQPKLRKPAPRKKPKKLLKRKSIQAEIHQASGRKSPRIGTPNSSSREVKVLTAPLMDVKVALTTLRYLGSTKSATAEKIAKVVKPQSIRLDSFAESEERRNSHYKCAYVGTTRDSQNSSMSVATDAYVPFMNTSMTTSAKSVPQMI